MLGWKSISLPLLLPTGDQPQGLLYLGKSSMTKIYVPSFFETELHYLAQSVPSLTILPPQPSELLRL